MGRTVEGGARRWVARGLAWALSLALAVAEVSAPAEPEAAGGLEIAGIQILPRRPAVAIVSDGDGLRAVDPATGATLPPAAAEARARGFRPGERIRFRGRVVNRGASPTGPFRYAWRVDRRLVLEGEHPGLAPRCRPVGPPRDELLPAGSVPLVPLAPGSFVDLELPWRYRARPQLVSLSVTPRAPTDALSLPIRHVRSDTRAVLVVVRQRVYEAMASRAAAGGLSLEAWAHQQIQTLRSALVDAVPPVTQGDLRLDDCWILPDGAPDDAIERLRRSGWWDAVIAVEAPPRDPEAFAVAGVLVELGLHPPGALAVAAPRSRLVRPDTGEPLLLGYGAASEGPWYPGDPPALTEYAARALGRRLPLRLQGTGVHLLDLPRENVVRVLDNEGRPVPEASLVFYQTREGAVDPAPVFAGKTNAQGRFPLPDRPAPLASLPAGFATRPNPFGALALDGSNGTFLVQIQARGVTDFTWLPVTQFNLAYWRGQRRRAVYDLVTRAPADERLLPPARFDAVVTGGPAVELAWSPVPHPHLYGYFVYRADPPEFEWTLLDVVSYRLTRYRDTGERRPLPRGTVRYAVTAVTRTGRESAPSPARAVTLP